MATTNRTADGHVPEGLRSFLHTLEGDPRTDALSERVKPIAEQLNAGPQGALLRGQHIGHALHPLLTNLPLGCWTAANLLDLLGGRRSAPAAQRLIGLGLLMVPPTAVTGLVDWDQDAHDPRIRRVGLVHAAANIVATGLYLASWNARRSGSRGRGIVLGLLGGGVASVSGYLGGHLSFARGSGQGARGLDEHGATRVTPDTAAAGIGLEGTDDAVPDAVGAAMSGIDVTDPPA